MSENQLPYVAEPTEQNQPALINHQSEAQVEKEHGNIESAILSDNDENSESLGARTGKATMNSEIQPMLNLEDTRRDEPKMNESEIESNFLRHIIKQRSGNFPDLKRKYDSKQENQSIIYDIISSNENTNRNKKLLQGAEWVSRSKMNNMLYENRVFYNGVEHKLLSRKKSKFNACDGHVNKRRKTEDTDFDLNVLTNAEDILKPISSLKDIVTHPTIKKTFMNVRVFNDLETQTALMIEKAKIESETLNDYVSVFLGDDPTAYLEDKMKLPEYDHHINFEKNDFNDKIYLDLEDVLRENGKNLTLSEDEAEEAAVDNVESKSVDKEVEDGIIQLNDQIRNAPVDEAQSVSEAFDNNIGGEAVKRSDDHVKDEAFPETEDVKPVEIKNEKHVDYVTSTAPAVEENHEGRAENVEVDKSDSNDMHVIIEKSEDIVSSKPNEDKPLPTDAETKEENKNSIQAEIPNQVAIEGNLDEESNVNTAKQTLGGSDENIDEKPEIITNDNNKSTSSVFSSDDEYDPFFGLPQYEKTTLNQRLFDLAEYDPDTTQQIAFSRQLTQILLQRNQEFIKNMVAIRQHFFKIERIRERLVKWGHEYSGVPEEDVEVPNVLTAVKRGLISASTNRTSISGQGQEGFGESGDENDEEE